MADTKIEWADKVWNPFVGCTRIGPDCQHCYAERWARRLKAAGHLQYEDVVSDRARWTGKLSIVADHWNDPYLWKKPRRIFVNSMSDFFHQFINDGVRGELVDIMGANERHTFMVLTKRSHEMKDFLEAQPSLPPNVLWGVSLCDQETHDARLLSILPLKTRQPVSLFVSYEPALGSVDFASTINALSGIIAGGETGYGARPNRADWFRRVRDLCVARRKPFFFKQWGDNGPFRGRLLDGEEWNQFPRI